MPLIIDEKTIKSNYEVVRYLDTTKFISMLQRQKLFFCRVDKFEDKFEGKIPQGNYNEILQRYQQWKKISMFDFGNFTDEQIQEKSKLHYSTYQDNKVKTYVNCWNQWEGESHGLWKIYGDQGKGIMVKSSIERMKKSLSGIHNKIFVSKVNYIDFEKETIETVIPFRNFTIKHKAYNYENEIRLLHMYDPEETYSIDKNDPDQSTGLYFPCDVSALIEEVIVGPFASKWYFEIIEDLCKKYNLDSVKLSLSELS